MSPVVRLMLARLRPAERKYTFDALVEKVDDETLLNAVKAGIEMAAQEPTRPRAPRGSKQLQQPQSK